jgi:hypothetical protein
VFSHGALGDPAASMLSYRAEALGYTDIVVSATTDVEVLPLTALTGTSGNPNKLTFSAHSDGRIYVENRLVPSPRTVSLFVIGAPL